MARLMALHSDEFCLIKESFTLYLLNMYFYPMFSQSIFITHWIMVTFFLFFSLRLPLYKYIINTLILSHSLSLSLSSTHVPVINDQSVFVHLKNEQIGCVMFVYS